MKYLKLSKTELEKLFKLLGKDASVQSFQRVQAIKLSSKGHSIKGISEMLDVHYNSAYHWIRKYQLEGIDGLLDKPKSGRPRKISDSEMKIVESIVNEEPRSIKVSIPKIEKQLGTKISLWTVQRALKRINYSYKRTRKSLKHKRDEKKFNIKKNSTEI
jgi:transposase